MTIVDMLKNNADKYPDDTALIELKPSKDIRLEISWSEFDERSNRVANALASRGIKKGDKVIHLMRNCIDWLVAYFGIIKTGAWAVPLNYRFTSTDIKYCAYIAEAQAMILQEEFIDRIEQIKPELTTIKHYIGLGSDLPDYMEDFKTVVADSKADAVEVDIAESDSCGLYFTSGTTGDPKPILLTHKNMEHAAVTEQMHHKQTREDNFILLPPLYHTGAKMHWFGNLLSGSRATLLTEISPRYIFEAVHKERGTIVWLLVPWAHDIVVAIERGDLNIADYDLSSWRLMHIGAQQVPTSLVMQWKELFPDMQYDENYGLSESTGPGVVHLGMENVDKVGATGKPGYKWEARIVDEHDNDVPTGQTGELIVKGPGVLQEYYKNPQKTAETIKGGWLHTGDIAKMDEDGFIYIVDRKKDIINSGGENIFPAEIEELLESHPKIYDVAVIGIPDDRLGEIVAAVIDPKPDQTLTEDEIDLFCESLPRYKRPRRVIFDKVPRNPTGKLEKPQLRQKYS
ncbi:MAG: AMP-binding protein [Chloroflexi bacterium]|jgi:acyl-CoA synthetase (AMP-forming)/AMP-acid ligase II|nr:AMP-binding protein [Chloroflexota bacterium]MBT7079938.1 AMP-binding protein [Chloroflexota bacterium]MBT7290230.1 AMP-binding protein [Chloroflexota bacterium]